MPFHISPLINAERGNKAFYNYSTSPSLDQMKDKHEVKWSFVFKNRLSENTWRNIYKSCFKATFLYGSNIEPFTEFLEQMAI